MEGVTRGGPPLSRPPSDATVVPLSLISLSLSFHLIHFPFRLFSPLFPTTLSVEILQIQFGINVSF